MTRKPSNSRPEKKKTARKMRGVLDDSRKGELLVLELANAGDQDSR